MTFLMFAQQLSKLEANQTLLSTQLPKSSIDTLLPIDFLVTDKGLVVNANEISAKISHNDIELVVIGDISGMQLHHLITAMGLNHLRLTTINHRLGQDSYRFSIECQDVSAVRTTLANIALAEKFEAALIVNAPTLKAPGLLVMDMDSTTIEIECIDEIAALAGVGEQVAQVTEQAMQGELDFAQSLVQRVATLKGAPESILAEVANNIPLMKGLKPLIAELKKHEWRIAIASGGFTYFADHLKDTLGLDDAKANVLAIKDSLLTGEVLGDIVDAQAKADTLAELGKKYDISQSQFVAMGDGANDLVMMNAAQLGVAFHAKPIVLKQADCAINNHGLDYLVHWLR